MKIGLPISDRLLVVSERLAPSFHHTTILGIYDTVSNTLETLDFEQENHPGGFTGIMKERGIEAVVSPVYSPVVLKLFKMMDINPYKASGSTINKNVEALQKGILPIYSFAEALEASAISCDSALCGSCSSTC